MCADLTFYLQLYKWCLDAIVGDPQLNKHKRLLEALGTQGMSLDESDTEVPGRSIAYPHIYPKWCSKQQLTFSKSSPCHQSHQPQCRTLRNAFECEHLPSKRVVAT